MVSVNEGLWTLLGVVIGATLPTLASIWRERRLDRRAAEDRAERREERLFDARREAFESLQSTARGLIDDLWEHHAGISRKAPPDYDFADVLVADVGRVHLYGSPQTVEAAEALLKVLVGYQAGDSADVTDAETMNRAYDGTTNALKDFAAAARADLGAEPGS